MSASPPAPETPSAGASASATGSVAPVVPPKVHPLARKLAGLLSDMSLKDQLYASTMHERIIYGSLLVSYPIAYMFGNVLISVTTVLAAGALCLVLFVPNWRQEKDPGLKFADDTLVYYYYKQLEAARLAEKEGPQKEETEKEKTE